MHSSTFSALDAAGVTVPVVLLVLGPTFQGRAQAAQ